MTSVFIAFVPGGSSTIQQIALGLAVGVFVDAFLVRMTLVPGRAGAARPPRLVAVHDWLERRLPVGRRRGRRAAPQDRLRGLPGRARTDHAAGPRTSSCATGDGAGCRSRPWPGEVSHVAVPDADDPRGAWPGCWPARRHAVRRRAGRRRSPAPRAARGRRPAHGPARARRRRTARRARSRTGSTTGSGWWPCRAASGDALDADRRWALVERARGGRHARRAPRAASRRPWSRRRSAWATAPTCSCSPGSRTSRSPTVGPPSGWPRSWPGRGATVLVVASPSRGSWSPAAPATSTRSRQRREDAP